MTSLLQDISLVGVTPRLGGEAQAAGVVSEQHIIPWDTKITLLYEKNNIKNVNCISIKYLHCIK